MKKNGFTLIELLAVIVILAIIALIATPIILGIINDAREKANERSIELYASALRNGIAAYQLRELKEVAVGSYTSETLPFDVEYDGKVDCTEIILSEDSKVSLLGCKVNNSDKEYNYGIEEKQSELAKLCTPNTEKAKALVWDFESNPMSEGAFKEEEVGLLASPNGTYTPGVAYTCNFGETKDSSNLTFFVLESTETEVTLIAGFMLGTAKWCGDETLCKSNGEWDTTKGSITANAFLADKTSIWDKLTDEQKTTIKLPTMDQIENTYVETMPKWLYSFTKGPIVTEYWTASTYEDSFVASVGIDGKSISYYPDGELGIRPVITLSI